MSELYMDLRVEKAETAIKQLFEESVKLNKKIDSRFERMQAAYNLVQSDFHNRSRTRIDLLQKEVACLRSVLSEWDEPKDCYLQMNRADALREVIEDL